MFRKKFMPVVLGLALLVPIISFADTNVEAVEKEGNFGRRLGMFAEKFQNDEGRKEFAEGRFQKRTGEMSEEMVAKMEEIRTKIQSGELTPETVRPGRFKAGNREMSEEMKAKMEEIKAKVESGELTPEEAREQMGLKKFRMRDCEISEDMKAKMEEIKAKVEGGTLTPEEAREEMRQFKQEKLQNLKQQ